MTKFLGSDHLLFGGGGHDTQGGKLAVGGVIIFSLGPTEFLYTRNKHS